MLLAFFFFCLVEVFSAENFSSNILKELANPDANFENIIELLSKGELVNDLNYSVARLPF
jgi:hypothetical protein